MNPRVAILLFTFVLSGVVTAFTLPHPGDDGVPYPDGYRRWAHVKSAYQAPKSDNDGASGFRHIYANAQALQGYETGRFPDGAVIVFDLLAGVTKDGHISEGPRRRVDVMHRDSARFAATGGWGFERFRGDSRERAVADRAATVCFSCHASRESQGYVFSQYRP